MENDKEHKLNTINYIYDDIRKIVNSCVIKFENIASAGETATSVRNFDHYLIATREIDTFDSYRNFPREVIRNAGVLDVSKLNEYTLNKHAIPKELRNRILIENRKYIIENYVELNNYYRTLIGLPDLNDKDFVYLDADLCERYNLDPNKPIHEFTVEEIATISYHMNDIITKYPDKKYLNFLGPYAVDLIRARTARNFEIIRADMSSHIVFLRSFFSTYNMCREYFTSVIYVREKYLNDELYDNFIAMSIMLMCIQRVMVNTFKLGVELDFYDLHSIQTFFNSYGVPFFEVLPLDYQRRIMKNVNQLLRAKSTDNCLYDIANLLFLDRVTIVQYYLMKEQLYDDNDKPLELKREFEGPDGEMILKEDVHNMYDIYFQTVDIKEKNINLALEVDASRVDYYETIEDDPYWWDDDDVLQVLTEKEFNCINTKYLGINIMYKLTDLMFQTVYFINMLADKKNEIYRPQLNFFLTIKLPRITTIDVSIFDAVILLCALTCKKNKFAGNIIKTGTKILTVMGFDFEENLTAIREDIKNNPKVYDQQTLKYIEKMNIHSKSDINNLYNNLVGLAEFCIDKMNTTTDVKVFHAYRQLYDSMMIKKYTSEILKKENGEVADTYLDYLNDQQPMLADFVNSCSIDEAGVYIDHILGTLNELIPDLEYLSSINGTDNIMITALVKLIEFFKSYTVELKTINILYLFDDKRFNMIRMVADPRFTVTFEQRERVAYYLDTLGIRVENLVEELVKPLEKIYIHSKIIQDERFNEQYRETIMMNVRTIYEDVFKIIYSDYINSMINDIEYEHKTLLDEMQMYMIKLYIKEDGVAKVPFDKELEMTVEMILEDLPEIRYGDWIKYIGNNIEIDENTPLDERIRYYINLLLNDSIKFVIDSYIKGSIYEEEFMNIRYVDWVKQMYNKLQDSDVVNLDIRDKIYTIFNLIDKKEIQTEHDFKINITEEDYTNIRYADWLTFAMYNGNVDDNILIEDLLQYYINGNLVDGFGYSDKLNEISNELDHNDSMGLPYYNTLDLVEDTHADNIIKLNENIRIYYE